MFKFGCEFSLLISPLHIYKRRPYFGIYLPMLFLPFLLVELVRMVKVCAISFKICMRLGLARKKNNSTHIKEKIVGCAKKKWSKEKANLKTKETGSCLKQLTGFSVLFARWKYLKTLTVLLTGKGTTLACAGYIIFEKDLTSFYEMKKWNLAVDRRGNVLTWKWNSASILSRRLLCGKTLVTMRSTGRNRIAWWKEKFL